MNFFEVGLMKLWINSLHEWPPLRQVKVNGYGFPSTYSFANTIIHPGTIAIRRNFTAYTGTICVKQYLHCLNLGEIAPVDKRLQMVQFNDLPVLPLSILVNQFWWTMREAVMNCHKRMNGARLTMNAVMIVLSRQRQVIVVLSSMNELYDLDMTWLGHVSA